MPRQLREGHKKLPMGIPELFYAGKYSSYPHSTRYLDEFDDPALTGRPHSSAVPLVYAIVIPVNEIAGHRSIVALTLL